MTKACITEEQSLRNWNENYWSRAALSAGKNIAPGLQSHIADAMIHLCRDDTKIVLEIPCGDGCNTVMLARSVPKIVAIDASSQAVGLVRRTLTRRTLPHRRISNVVFQRGDIYHTDLFESSFDGIFCWDLLSYLQQPGKALSELRCLCRSGGRIVGSLCSIADGERGVQMVSLDKEETYLNRDQCYVRYFSETEARELLLRQSGCELIQFYSIQWSDSLDEQDAQQDAPCREAWVFVLERH